MVVDVRGDGYQPAEVKCENENMRKYTRKLQENTYNGRAERARSLPNDP